MTYLSKEFVQKYADKTVPLTPLGLAIMKRTYANWLPQLYGAQSEKRRERWHEIVERVVNWSLGMYPQGAVSPLEASAEAEELYDTLFNARGFVSGRTNFVAGKDIPGEAHFNCGFTTETTAQDFGNLLALLMSGVGVGGRNDPASLNKNIPLTRKPLLAFDGLPTDSPERPARGRESTWTDHRTSQAYISVGDTREGWRDAIIDFFKVISFGAPAIVVNDDELRVFGAPLGRMGGFASGPGPFREALKNIVDVLFADDDGWTGVKVTDVRNILGQLAVAAGTRRSAEISLGDADDEAFARMKEPENFGYDENFKPTKNVWRFQSNNSNIYFEKPSREELISRLRTAYRSGEPGFINGAAALRRRKDFRGLNPCAEILLTDDEFCNLTSINLPKFVVPGTTKIDRYALERTIRLLVRHSIRVTFVQLSDFLAPWQRNLERDRLLGVSFTGLYDLLGVTGLDKERVTQLFEFMRYTAHDEAINLSFDLRTPTPLLVTTVKPEGTLSKLTDSSSGLHPKYAPYYIQRLTVSKHDAVHDALAFAGVPYEDKDGDATTSIFEFPMHAPGTVHAKTMPAITQLEMYKLAMEQYVDHNASVTVYITEEEIPHVARWLHANWDSYVGVSFFAKTEGTFRQAPWEEIDNKEYHRRSAELAGFSEIFEAALTEIERSKGDTAVEEFEKCDTGACPVR